MASKFFLCGDSSHPITRKSYVFHLGPLHYKVVYYCGEFAKKTFAYVELVLDSVDPEPRDPNVNYDRLEYLKSQENESGTTYVGYGVTKGTSYAFRILATLAAILRDIIRDEKPDEFLCAFTNTAHSSCWRTFFKYIAKPTQAIKEITVEPSQFQSGGEEWVISLNK